MLGHALSGRLGIHERLNMCSSMGLKVLLFLTFISFMEGCGRCSRDQLIIRIGITPWPSHEFFFLAQEKGFFERRGLDVKIIEYHDLSDSRRAFERDQIDVMAVSPFEVLLSREYSHKRTQVFAVTDVSDGADMLIAHKSIRSLSELKGKVLGADVGSVSFQLLARALESNSDISLQDMVVIPLSQPRAEKALKKGEIDAVVTYAPYALKILENPNFHSLFTSKNMPGEIVDVLAAEEEQIQTYEEQFAQFVDGYTEAIRYAHVHPEEAFTFMAERLHISAKEIQQSLRLVKLLTLEEQSLYLGPEARIKDMFSLAGRILQRTGYVNQPYKESKVWTDRPLNIAIKMQKDQPRYEPN
jgi:NitT/TauT family transport system substrate-binding protein